MAETVGMARVRTESATYLNLRMLVPSGTVDAVLARVFCAR